MKPLVVAVGIDSDVINAKSEYYDHGFVKIGKYTINNFDRRGRGWVTVQDILNQSLNTGMTFVASKIPKNIFREYFKKYGFGEKSGIDLPQDSSGLSSNLKSHRDIEFANISFGQGIAISPISFIKAGSALANKGKTVTPHVVKKIEYTNGFSKTLEFPDGEQVFSEETGGEISRMLVNVFDNYRKGKAKLPHHSVAAKTGTAQIPAPGGGYYSDRNLHSFFAYFPAYEPKYIVLLYTVHPKGIKYSSQTLLDPFRSIAKYLINYYQIPADR
jgi:cell division protein FtsI/penicillin-binding protein 2